MISERKRVASVAVISAWVVLVAAFSAVVGGEIQDLALYERTESFQGPFDKESPDTSHALVAAIGEDSRLGKLLSTSGDTPDNPRRSNLRLWVNGQPAGPGHTLHAEIRTQGNGRYSHWGDALLFSLPAGTTNGPTTTALVKYSPRMRPAIYGLACLALVLSPAFLVFRAWQRDPDGVRQKRDWLARSARHLCLTLYAAAAVATTIYLVTIAIGIVQGYSLPNTAVFRLLPWTRRLAIYEPAAHLGIVFIAMVGAVLSWLAPSTFSKDEATLVRYWTRYGLLVIASLFLFSLGATWSGLARPEDLQGNGLGGLVPLWDAHGYFATTFDQVITGHWGPIAEQRPFAAAHRSLLMFLTGYSNVRFLLLQAFLVACVTYTATRAVMLWRGLWSGLMFLGLTVALVRPYLITHLTEPLGLFWTLLAVPFVIRLLRRGALVDGTISFLAITLSLLTRMGSMFTIPAFAMWLVWTESRGARRFKPTFATIALVLAGCSLVSATLLRLYGSGTGLVGSNFSFVICGATHGGDWTTCKTLYENDLRNVGPGLGATQARYLYAKAWEAFRRDPSILFRRLIEGEQIFVENLVPRMLCGYSMRSIPRWFPRTAWTIIALCGLIMTFWRRRERRELSFWLFTWVGLLTSVPLVIFADGWRILSSTLPFVALFFACGFATHADVASSVLPAGSGTSKLALTGVVLTIALWIVIPGLAHWLDPLGARSFQTVTSKSDQHVVLGSSHVAGFVVIPDSEPVPTNVPSMPRSEFTKAWEYSGHPLHEGVTFRASSPPVAIIVAPDVNGTHGILYVYLAPTEVLSRQDVRAWQFTVDEEFAEDENVRWARVGAATPVTPAPR